MTVWHDVRYAVRSFHRTPVPTGAAVLTFALAIGANTAVFCVFDAVVLRPLAFADPDRLVVLHQTLPRLGTVPVGAADFERWRAGTQSFERMALMAAVQVVLTGAGVPERLDAARVSADLFPMLGVHPALGRTFDAGDEADRHRMVVLSDGVWRSRFGADPAIVGRSLTLDDQPYVVAGVLPPQFLFPRLERIFAMGIAGGRPQVWMPFAISDADRAENSFAAIAKLRPGVSVAQAAAELTAIQRSIAQQGPGSPGLGAAVVPLETQITGASSDTLALLWAGTIAVLAIACGNIVNLLLVRTIARRADLAIRSALGASRRALLRHSLMDSLTLAGAGGAGGVLVALWVLPLIVRFAPATVPRLDEVALDARALGFAFLLTTGTGLAVALLPAARASGTSLIAMLSTATRTHSGTRRDRTIAGLMVGLQAAFTIACLAAAGLVIQSLWNVLAVERGFQTERILTVEIGLSPSGRYAAREARAAFAREALRRLERLPGVTAVGLVNRPPLSGVSLNSVLAQEGTERAPVPLPERPQADVRSVDAGYFRALGIPLLGGRLFDEREGDRPVAVISAAMARRAWPLENPIGKRFRLSAQPARLVEVVGIVGDVRNMGLETDPTLAVYLPYWQMFLNGTSFVLRTSSEAAPAGSAVRSIVAGIDRDVPVETIKTMESVVADSVAGRAFQATLLALFGAVAVVLAGVGVFGVVSNTVAQQAKELGIRLALGASPPSVRRMVCRDVRPLLAVGVALGVPLAVASGYGMRSLLFGVEPQSPLILGAAAALVVLAAAVAAWIPARRVTRIDPAATLRTD